MGGGEGTQPCFKTCVPPIKIRRKHKITLLFLFVMEKHEKALKRNGMWSTSLLLEIHNRHYFGHPKNVSTISAFNTDLMQDVIFCIYLVRPKSFCHLIVISLRIN